MTDLVPGRDYISFEYRFPAEDSSKQYVGGKFSELPDSLQRKVAEEFMNQPIPEKMVIQPELEKPEGWIKRFFKRN